VGRFSIEPGESIPLDGWRFGAGEDHGAPTFQPIPHSSAAQLHRELGQWLQSSRAPAE